MLFQQWGLSHVLARSGLHLVIFVFIWRWLLNFLPLSFYRKNLLLLFISLVYALCSWPSVSFIRAWYALIFYFFCALFLRRPSHTLHIISLVYCIILFLNPLQLFFLDFQLSFLLTYALTWMGELSLLAKRKPLP